MNAIINSPLFGIFLTLVAFETGVFISKKFKYSFLNPLRLKADEELYDAFAAHGIHRVCSFGLIPPKDEADFMKRPFNWR